MHRRRDLPIVQEKPRTRARRAKPDELTAARERIAELEARATQHARAEQVQAALYRIAETASAVEDMPAFYAAIHEIVGGLMYAENFYIALYDERRAAHQLPVLHRLGRRGHPRPERVDPVRDRRRERRHRLRAAARRTRVW